MIDFGNLITKKLSLLICSHVLTENKPKNVVKLKDDVQGWMKKQKVAGFYNLLQNSSFEDGATASLSLSGLGRLAPNMLLLGFRAEWDKSFSRTMQYINIWKKAYDHKLSVIILRLRGGLDFSSHIVDEELIEAEDMEPDLVENDCANRQMNKF